MTLFPRRIEAVLRKAASEFPAVVLTGPRQAGKTTVLRRVFGDRYRYLLLDLPDVRAAALEDPRGLLDAYPPPLILDEVQQAPELLPYLKARIDEDRGRPGQYILTGSQNLLRLEKVQESLAGRVAVLKLLPGTEVDLLVEHGGKLVPLEVKLSATPRPAMASGIHAFRQAMGESALPGWVVHSGNVRLPLGPETVALPFVGL